MQAAGSTDIGDTDHGDVYEGEVLADAVQEAYTSNMGSGCVFLDYKDVGLEWKEYRIDQKTKVKIYETVRNLY